MQLQELANPPRQRPLPNPGTMPAADAAQSTGAGRRDGAGPVIALARGFDTHGVHGAVLTTMPAWPAAVDSSAGAARRRSALDADPAWQGQASDNDRAWHGQVSEVDQAWHGQVWWPVIGLKALALAVALGAAYLAGLYLLGPPAEATPAQGLATPALWSQETDR